MPSTYLLIPPNSFPLLIFSVLTLGPRSMNSLFSDLFREFGRVVLDVVRDYLGETVGGFCRKNKGSI